MTIRKIQFKYLVEFNCFNKFRTKIVKNKSLCIQGYKYVVELHPKKKKNFFVLLICFDFQTNFFFLLKEGLSNWSSHY
jgi:hypothetical protein